MYGKIKSCFVKRCNECGLSSSNKKEAPSILCHAISPLRGVEIKSPLKCKFPEYYIMRNDKIEMLIPEYYEKSQQNFQVGRTFYLSILAVIIATVIIAVFEKAIVLFINF